MRAPTPEQMRALADRAQQWSDRADIKHKPGQTLAEFAAALRAAADQLEAVRRVMREAVDAEGLIDYEETNRAAGAAAVEADVLAILTPDTAPQERAS
jgi:hypothetical protein